MRYPTNNPIRGQRWSTRKPDKTRKFNKKPLDLKDVDIFCNEKKDTKKSEDEK